MKIKQQLGNLDFVSYCGGSLGLFLGFSVLSAIEIIYYFTIRLFFKRIWSKKVSNIVNEENRYKMSYIEEFLSVSHMQGCNQLVKKERHPLERF
jgi:hypothetical protein